MILLVEDEPTLRLGICDLLEGDGHQVVAVSDGERGLAEGLHKQFSLVVLDLMLPGKSGFEVCQKLRSAKPNLPILMLTALGSEDDRVRGFLEGTDDYMLKPFIPRELLLRVRALLRRAPPAPALDHLEVDGCSLDLARHRGERGSSKFDLAAKEVGILRYLYEHRDRAVSRAELLEQIWSQRGDLQTRAVDMAIATLRKKIEENAGAPRIIVSVKSVGYAWGALPVVP